MFMNSESTEIIVFSVRNHPAVQSTRLSNSIKAISRAKAYRSKITPRLNLSGHRNIGHLADNDVGVAEMFVSFSKKEVKYHAHKWKEENDTDPDHFPSDITTALNDLYTDQHV